VSVQTDTRAGIGKATAASFARYGIQRLALADMNLAALKATGAELKEKYPGLEVLDLDLNVRDRFQVRDGLAETVKRFGRLDVAVNNAGIGGSGKCTHETPDEEWEAVLDVDLHGVYRCQKEQLKLMVDQE
jgi:NAD(P)-dependent dehydrogenase (short-subunit alcohol dehydrogenase family)